MLFLDTGELSVEVKKSKTYDFSLFEEISRDEVYQMVLTLKKAAEEFKESESFVTDFTKDITTLTVDESQPENTPLEEGHDLKEL